jgi:outer membrane protein W
MNFFNSNKISRWMLAIGLLVILVAPLYAANNALDPTATAQAPNPQSDLHIGKAHGFLGAHAGMNFPRGGSDLFDMVTSELTLDKSDFRSPEFGFDLGFNIKSRYALVFALDCASASPVSESRKYTEANGNAIVQTTEFRQIPFTATFRYYTRNMGEKVGSFVWTPTRVNPYIGGGGGFLHYSFNQYGSFVDVNTLDIFDGNLSSSGVSWTGHVAGGVDVSITSRLYANFEVKYSFAHRNLSKDFVRFKPIDLFGLWTTAGIGFRF